jgi:hypothetical protein
MGHAIYDFGEEDRPAWNVGRKLGAKRPLVPKQVWAVRFFLEQEHRFRDRALFDLAIHSKLRGCDLVKIKIDELVSGLAFDSELSWSSKRLAGQCSSSSWCPLEQACSNGLSGAVARWTSMSFPAALTG